MWEIPAALAIADFIGQERTNASNAQMAGNQIGFQQNMSSTSHQREVADLRAAGLNPILSARYGGSSTPAGAMAVMQNSAGSAARTFSDQYRAGLEGRRNPSQIRLNEASAAKADASAGLDVANTGLSEVQARRLTYEVEKVLPSQVELNSASAAEKRQIISRMIVEIRDLIPAQVKQLGASASASRASAAKSVYEYSSFLPGQLRLNEQEVERVAAEIKILREDLKSAAMKGEVSDTAYGAVMEFLKRLPGVGGLLGGLGGGMLLEQFRRDRKRGYIPN